MKKVILTHQRKFILIASFLIPSLIMLSYFAYRSMAPFGNSSILTVDLGQQYIDFFAYFRSTLLHHWDTFFYSFSKGLGGDTLGIFSYYLMSPLNLLILFFPGKYLSIGILFLLVLKYGLAGLSFAWLLDKTGVQTGVRLFGFSTAYALMGWMIANQLNIIWLDVLIILPLVIYGLIKLLNGGSAWTYIIWLAIMMIDNYYMAWMVALFTVLFMIYEFSSLQLARQLKIRRLFKYVGASMVSALFAAWILIPTVYSLLQSKGTYTETKWSFKFEYFPFKMLAKLITGSFNFDQMPNGQPNIFVGSLILIAFLLYFSDRRFSLKNKLTTLGITIFLLFSMCIKALDLVWHAGQFPVWYPYRFSFVFCFWLIWLAAKVLTPKYQPSRIQIASVVVLLVAMYTYLALNLKQFSYLSTDQLMLSAGVSFIAIAWLTIPRHYTPIIYDILFLILVIGDSGLNAVSSLNNISYVSQSDFGQYTTQLNKTISKLPSTNHKFYRVGQTFMRTKDDPMQGDYASGSHFGSTLEPAMPAFMGNIGQPDGDGFVTYTNGTQVTDSLLSMQYFMTTRTVKPILGSQSTSSVLPKVSNKPDLNRYSIKSEDSLTQTFQNKNALSIAFGASKKILSTNLTTKDPLAYQALIYQALAGGDTKNDDLYEVQNFDSVNFDNVQKTNKITGVYLNKQSLLKPASITMKFTPKTNGSYYLTMGSSLDEDSGTYYLNGKEIDQYPTYRNTIVVNVASKQKDQPITITFKFKKQSMWLQNVSLYTLKQNKFNQINKQLKSQSMNVTSYSNTDIKGNISIKKANQLLMTTIPYSHGWKAYVDGHSVKTTKTADTFISIPITRGSHKIEFKYHAPYFLLGTLISIISILLAFCYWRIRK